MAGQAATKRARTRYVLALLSVVAASPALAQPTIDPAFGDHAVIQRDQPIFISGSAAPGEAVHVALGQRSGTARADAAGHYAVELAPIKGGLALSLEVSARSGVARSRDLLTGDVFLCSGQSNMELQVSRAQDGYNQAQASADDQLRLMMVGKTTALTPQTSFAKPPVWAAAAPTTTPDFSAACFYMAQELRKTTGVPVGAIADSWGGTAISAWMGERALRAAGLGADADLLRVYARDPAAAALEVGERWGAWWRKTTGDPPGSEPWQPGATLDWQPVPAIGYWENWGVPALAAYDGMVWFRRDVELTPAQARQPATLEIGAVDDMDQSWVNGVPVGSGGNPGTPRAYPLPAGRLKAGANAIVVNANDVYGRGGMTGPAEAMRLHLADGSSVPLGTGWRYAVEGRHPGNPPRAPWDDVAGAGVIYNAMIAPLGRIGLKGVAWYQGESDVGSIDYASRIGAMMADWRQRFGQPVLPFVITQLSAFGASASAPVESGWAALRAQQRRAAAADPHAALAITVDLGDPLDIHPGEKHEVGRRLARAMGTLAYGGAQPASGPAIAQAHATGDGVELRFAGVTGGLHTRGADRAIGFELCGAAAGSCRYALGRVEGDRVLLAGDGRPVTRVRYAWADSPTINLFDAAALPVGTFEIGLSSR